MFMNLILLVTNSTFYSQCCIPLVWDELHVVQTVLINMYIIYVNWIS